MRKMIFVLLLSLPLLALSNNPKDSVTRLKFGFNMGANYTALNFEDNFQAKSYNLNGPGFRIGLLADYIVTKRFSLFPKIELSFNQSGIDVLNANGAYDTKYIYPVTFEIAPHVAFNFSDKSLSPYIVLGPGLKIPLPGKNDPYLANTRTNTYCLDIGFGVNKVVKYFNFAPEIRYSRGINKITDIEGIKNLQFHNISLLVNFKG